MMNIILHNLAGRVALLASAFILLSAPVAQAAPQTFSFTLRNAFGQLPDIGAVAVDSNLLNEGFVTGTPGQSEPIDPFSGDFTWTGEPGSSVTLYGPTPPTRAECSGVGIAAPTPLSFTLSLAPGAAQPILPVRQSLVTPEYSSVEEEIIALFNAERARLGIAPVQKDDRLTYAADSQVYWQDRLFQTNTTSLTHCGNSHSDAVDRIEEWGITGHTKVGEIATGAPVNSAASYYVNTQWLNSSAHAAILRNSAYQWVGVGVSSHTGRAVAVFAACAPAPQSNCGQVYGVPTGAVIHQEPPVLPDELDTETEGNDGVLATSRFSMLNSRLYATKSRAGLRWHLVTRGRVLTNRGAVRFKNVVVASRKGARRMPLGRARTTAAGVFTQHRIVMVPARLRRASAARQRAWILGRYGRIVEARYAGDDATRRAIRTARIGS